MKISQSFPDERDLLCYLNEHYDLKLLSLRLYRDIVGSVYMAENNTQRYVYKLYRNKDLKRAEQAIQVMQFLSENKFSSSKVTPTVKGDLFTKFEFPEGIRIGVMMNYIEGKHPDNLEDTDKIVELTAKFHDLMNYYPRNIIELGYDFYIQRFIDYLQELNYSKNKLNDLKEYGDILWEKVASQPKCIYHGDLDVGNILVTHNGEFVLYDFDNVCRTHLALDFASICNKTSFFQASPKEIEKTFDLFHKFLISYGKLGHELKISEEVFSAYIAIKHYELNATVMQYRFGVEGTGDYLGNLDNQYQWLMNWKKLCF